MTRAVLALACSTALLAGCWDSAPSGWWEGPTEAELLAQSGEDAGLLAFQTTVFPLLQANCAECHGADLRGTDKGPSHLSEVYVPGHHGDGAFQLAVRVGSRQHHWNFGPMPPVEGLSDSDIAAIVAFVREQQRVEGFEPYPPG